MIINRSKLYQICQRIFPIYTKEIMIGLSIILVAFVVKGVQTKDSNTIQSIERPKHYDQSKNVDIYVHSDKYNLDYSKIELEIEPNKSTKEEELEYLAEVQQYFHETLDSVFHHSNVLDDKVSLPKNFYLCSVDYMVQSMKSIDSDGWIDIGILEEEGQEISETEHIEDEFMVVIPYRMKYKESELVGYYSVTVYADQFSQLYKNNFIQHSIKEEWVLMEELSNEKTLSLPRREGVTYHISKKPMNLEMYLKLFILLCLAISAVAHIEKKERIKIYEQQKRIQLTYFINNFILMYKTGLTIQRSFKIGIKNRVNTLSTDHPVYKCFLGLNRMILHETSIYELVEAFNREFELIECQRFTRLIIQNLKQGDHYLSIQLSHLAEKMWDERIRRARKSSEKASSKLVLPMVLIFIIILILTIVPTFLQVGSF